MATFKERERSGKKWDAEARGPGGGARQALFKKRAMGVEPTPPAPPPVGPTIRAQEPPKPRPAMKAVKRREEVDPQDDFLASIPSPGEHPGELQSAAEEKGRRVPVQANPFARLKASPQGAPTIRAQEVSQDGEGNGARKPPRKLPVPKPRNKNPGEVEEGDGEGGDPDYDYSRIKNNPPQVETEEDTEEVSDYWPQRKEPKVRKTSLRAIIPTEVEKRRKRREEAQEDPRRTSEAIRLLGLTETACDSCPLQETCEYFEEGALCAYGEAYQGLLASEDALPLIETLADYQAIRAHRAVLYEARLTGGQLSADVSRQIELAAQAAIRLQSLKTPKAEAPQSVTTLTFQHTEPQQGGGILSRLVAGMLGDAQKGFQERETEGIAVSLPPGGQQGREGAIAGQQEAIPEGGSPGPFPDAPCPPSQDALPPSGGPSDPPPENPSDVPE